MNIWRFLIVDLLTSWIDSTVFYGLLWFASEICNPVSNVMVGGWVWKKYKLMPSPMLGVEPRIFWLEVKRVNHYATRALLVFYSLWTFTKATTASTWHFSISDIFIEFVLNTNVSLTRSTFLKKNAHNCACIANLMIFLINTIRFSSSQEGSLSIGLFKFERHGSF